MTGTSEATAQGQARAAHIRRAGAALAVAVRRINADAAFQGDAIELEAAA